MSSINTNIVHYTDALGFEQPLAVILVCFWKFSKALDIQ